MMAEKKKRKQIDKRRKGESPGKKALWDAMDMPAKLPLIESWAKSGMLEQEMYNALGVSKDTWYRWKKDKQEFWEVVRRGKDVADAIVEAALFKRATGYKYDEVTRERQPKRDANGELLLDPETGCILMEMVEVKRVTKEQPADTTAAIFYLKNRKPAQWRDKQTIEHTGGINHSYEYMSDEELQKEIERLEGGNNGTVIQ